MVYSMLRYPNEPGPNRLTFLFVFGCCITITIMAFLEYRFRLLHNY